MLKATGGEGAVVKKGNYWTSSEVGTDDEGAFRYNFEYKKFYWTNLTNDMSYYVRACLTF